jgi:hypothetical protein
MVVPIPCPTFPAIEPDASNTIMASSLQGDIFGSAAMPALSQPAIPIAKDMGANRRAGVSATTILT